MNIYNYNKQTKEFIFENTARENPLEKGKFLIPADSTTVSPLDNKDGFAVCFNEEKEKWEYIEDNRGIWYNIREKVEITHLGPIDNKLTRTPVELSADEVLQQELDNTIMKYKQYLNDTDFYIIRKIEEGTDVPEEVSKLRLTYKEFLRSNDISFNNTI